MITIAGAGVAGLCCAYELAKRGAEVTIFERGASIAENPSSWFAGGMLAPFCEGETADPQVVSLGQAAIAWWSDITTVTQRGTLVLAAPRDRAELDRFSRRTTHHRWVNADDIATLEPALGGRFLRGLFFEDEAHIDPRRALIDLVSKVQSLGVTICYNTPAPDKVDVDCRGAASSVPGLRMIRGEMAVIEAPELNLSRTLRLLHPRIPLYLVPRGDGVFMIGATMVESASYRPITVRSLLELLGAAFALHPALAEASVIETGVGLRPAFDDNIPRLQQLGDTTHVNGLFRHGYLLAPALGRQLAQQFFQETTDETLCERQSA